ncbi:hypothetical protein NXY56_004815 [Leishmania guyanensis]|uniref:Membrane-associated protein n=1 Tax=Leishmania guyanensis TaxID=5670 RepID=A0A1E1J178_LEIGU|nr:hypothetical protein, conserved [Leishmania guyanensis]
MLRRSMSLRYAATITLIAGIMLLIASPMHGQSVATVAAPPPCDDHGTTYIVNLDEATPGMLSYQGTSSCVSNGTASIMIVKDPDLPHAVVPLGEWNYLVSVHSPTPATITLNAMCGNTVKCQSKVTYAVSQTMVSSSSSAPLPFSSQSLSSSESVLPGPTYPLCSHASKVRTCPVDGVLADSFPMDMQDSSCAYTTTISLEPHVGTVTLALSGLFYTYTPPSTPTVGDVTSLAYTVQCNGATVCADVVSVVLGPASGTTPPPGPPSTLPSCSHNSTVNNFLIGAVYFRELPLDLQDTKCAYKATIDDPSVGTAVATEPSDPTSYIYSTSPGTAPQDTSIPYTISCNGVNVCQGSVRIHLTLDTPTCPTSVSVFIVPPGSSLQGTVNSGSVCNTGAIPLAVVRTAVPGFTLHANGSFVFQAPDTEADVVVMVVMECSGVVLCQTKVVFAVSASTVAPPPTPTTAPIEACPKSFLYEVPTGESISGALDAVPSSLCNSTTYQLVNRSSDVKGNLSLNLLGQFLYTAPSLQRVDYVVVDVFCGKVFLCRTKLEFVAYTPVPTPSPTSSPLPPCANVYYYQTTPGVLIRSSLNNVPGQDLCAHGRYFKLNDAPQAGTLELALAGDFLFHPPTQEGQLSFTFTMYCLGQPFCTGTAYLLVSNEWTLGPTPTPSPSEPEGDTNITNKQITCRGTCNTKAWKTYPNTKVWDITPDTGYTRMDGRPVDGVTVTWRNSSLVVLAYSLIGNLGARFPTFELITTTPKAYMEPTDFADSVAAGSLSFEMSCLANQGRTGMGEDVWKWTNLSLASGTGSVGAYYSSGKSWYQKFGGKHVNCDTFTDPCTYAPLLTPASYMNSSLGFWTIDVKDCDVTWTGMFPFSSMKRMVKHDGSPVWTFAGRLQLESTLYSEAVQASSWLEPGQFDANYSAHNILINLNQFVTVTKWGVQKSLISVDAELFTYVDNETHDQAFGINMLVYPFVDSYMTTSYARDRHVRGFKWISQDWMSPSSEQCPTCTGSKTKCAAPLEGADVSYTGPNFPEGDCPNGEGRVHLFKGPAMMRGECPDNKMHVFNQYGFSPTQNCYTTYQNVTLRGIVPGSSGLNETLARAFNYEGTMQLILLMDDHSYVRVNLRLSMYVSRLSKDAHHIEGGISACRSGSYWPVLDPLGFSLASNPFPLSGAAVKPLCIDDLSSSYGPSDWALFTLNMPGVKPGEVTVRSVYVLHNNSRIYLIYKDPIDGALTIPSSGVDGAWWQYKYPFLAFRDLAAHVKNNSITYSRQMETSAAAANVVYAFTFIPGSLNVDTNIEVVVDALTQSDGMAASTVEFRRVLHVDPLLTQLSRQGPPPEDLSSQRGQDKTDLYAIGATAGVAAALVVTVIFFILADNSRPLPKWVPRGKLIKETVLSVLPAGLRGKKKPKRVVHKDMYDAMRSGRY